MFVKVCFLAISTFGGFVCGGNIKAYDDHNANNIQTRVYDPFIGCDLKMSTDRLFTKQMFHAEVNALHAGLLTSHSA